MKKFIKDIQNGIRLESSIPQYGSYLMELYDRKAAVSFAMDYYTYQGIIADNMTEDIYLKDFTRQFNDLVKTYVTEAPVDERREEGIKKLDGLRNSVYHVVEVLSAYADVFSRYEYVVNRCEYLFKEAEPSGKYSDEEFTRTIMQYIFSDEDNAVINMKISELLSELPLRMTKNKFFELLKNGMSVYEKSDKKTIDDFMYTTRSSALLALPEGMEDYQILWEILMKIQEVDYASVQKEELDQVMDSLSYAADYIEKLTNIYMMLQGLINKAYAMVIALPYVDLKEKNTANARNIIAKIHENFYNEDYITLEEDVTDSFIFLEGIPEQLDELIQAVEFVLDDVRQNHLAVVKSIMSDQVYLGLFLCEKLLTDSLFVDLSEEYALFEEKDPSDAAEFSEEELKQYLIQNIEKLTNELSTFFGTHQKLLNRSIMSTILSRLPVYFNNVTELQDYVYHSLSSCTNKAEKTACIEIVKSIMED